MNAFDEKRLAYGVENPLAKKGAKGYFSDSYKVVRGAVDANYTHLCELKDVDLSKPSPYKDEFGCFYKLFYVVEEAPSPQPLNDHELMELLGEKVIHKDGEVYDVRKFEKLPNEVGELLLLSCEEHGFVWVTAEELLEGYTLTNGNPKGQEPDKIGKEIKKMNEFDEKRVGYGRPNPMIAKGAKGYFSDYMSSLERYVRNDRKNDQYMELQSTEFGHDNPYEDQKGTCWKFFYVVEEAPELKYQPFSDKALLELLGNHIIDKSTRDKYRIATFYKHYLNESEVLVAHVDAKDNVWKTAEMLLDLYTFEDGSPVGEIQQ